MLRLLPLPAVVLVQPEGCDDEDDDAAALRAVYGATGSGNADAQETGRVLLFNIIYL